MGVSIKKINKFNDFVQERLDEMMLRNRVIKYIPRKRGLLERVRQWVKAQTGKTTNIDGKNMEVKNGLFD